MRKLIHIIHSLSVCILCGSINTYIIHVKNFYEETCTFSCGFHLFLKTGICIFIKSFTFFHHLKVTKLYYNIGKFNDKCMRIWSVCVKNRSKSDCIHIFVYAYASGCKYMDKWSHINLK